MPNPHPTVQFYAVWFSIATMGGMHLFIISTLIIDVFAWNFTDMTWYVILYGIVSNGASPHVAVCSGKRRLQRHGTPPRHRSVPPTEPSPLTPSPLPHPILSSLPFLSRRER